MIVNSTYSKLFTWVPDKKSISEFIKFIAKILHKNVKIQLKVFIMTASFIKWKLTLLTEYKLKSAFRVKWYVLGELQRGSLVRNEASYILIKIFTKPSKIICLSVMEPSQIKIS